MDEKIERIRILVRAAKSEQEWGGTEDSEGTLWPGEPDLDELEAQIIAILRE